MSENKSLLNEPVKHSGPIAWMAGNSVAANLLMVVLLVGGAFYCMRIKQEFFPDFDMDVVSVTVPYPGASPEEVEQGIVLAVEEAVRGLDGVDEVSSSSREGVGVVNINILAGADNQKVTQDIKQEVDRITTFPEDSEEHQVVLVSRRREVISLVIYGDHSESVLRELAEQMRTNLMRSPEITQVELAAVRPLEISIEISQDNLRAYNLTLEEVAAKMRGASVELPGGGIKTGSGEILLRMKERRDYGREFAEIPILSGSDGTEVLLGDIATIVDGFEDTDQYATFNGKRAVMVKVYRVGKQTPITVADAVRKQLKEMENDLPPGVGVAIQSDYSRMFRQRISLLLRNGRIGLILVFVLLAIFLESRLAFWVTMGIPISFLGSFLLLPLMGVTLNMVSLFAFLIALGIVVDDAIVVGENIYRYHQEGLPFLEAAKRGAREVAMPVTFSILTNIAAFMPLFFIPGIMGKVFYSIPAVVVLVFLISLIESLFVLPAHLGHQREKRKRLLGWLHTYQRRFSDWFSRCIKNLYGPFLDKVLHYRFLTLSIGITILALTVGYVASGRMGMEMFPKVESDFAVTTVVLPYGTSVAITDKVQQRLVKAAAEVARENGGDKLVDGIFAHIGGGSSGGHFGGGSSGGGHTAEVTVYLTPPTERPISTSEFVKLWRKRAGAIPGLESISFQADRGGPGSGAALTVELRHADINILEQASGDLAASLSLFAKVKDVDDGFSPGKQQFDFKIRPAGLSLGLTAMNIARQVRSSFYGAEVLRQQRGRNEIKVMVRLPKAERISEYDLEELLIRTPKGGEIPLREAAELTRGRAYTVINRREGQRTVTVTADVAPRSDAGQVLEVLKEQALPDLMRKYPGLQYGFEGRQADMAESISSLGQGFMFAMIVVYALLAIPLKSYIQPGIIMMAIPFGVVGAVFGHLIMGYSLSVMSMMGIVALSGVVINDSLILIEFANREQERGLSAHDAICSAGIRRFRPIMLTTLTTFGGLAPMIFETSRQARFLIPMALSLGYGILFATMITLMLVPCLFLTIADIRHFLKQAHAIRTDT